MARVLMCDEGDFDAGTGTCAAPYYGEPPTVIPTLTIPESQQIGLAFAGLFALAFVFKKLFKMIEQL